MKHLTIGFDAKRAVQNLTGIGNYSRLVLDVLTSRCPENRYLLCGIPVWIRCWSAVVWKCALPIPRSDAWPPTCGVPAALPGSSGAPV